MASRLQHVKDHGPMYGLITAIIGAGGLASVTGSLPVSQAEFRAHLVAYQAHVAEYETLATDLRSIKDGLDQVLLQQLRQALRDAYRDKCTADDARAIRYINREIEDLQDIYGAMTGRRYQPAPCEESA